MDDAERGDRLVELETLKVANGAAAQAFVASTGQNLSFASLLMEVVVDGLYPPGSDERLAFDLRWEGAKRDALATLEVQRLRALLTQGVAGPASGPVGLPNRANGQR